MFVCLSTKAVHLESVASLTKEDCIFALNRFIARRGMPSKILSDNGTNFLGARSDLIKIEALLNKGDKNHSIISFVTEKNCEWITIDQQEIFPTEYKKLKKKQSLLKKNQLQNLAPFFDPDYNVIRVGGRLSQSLYSESKKFPLLVSKNSKLVNFII